jgi:hypothetical protein
MLSKDLIHIMKERGKKHKMQASSSLENTKKHVVSGKQTMTDEIVSVIMTNKKPHGETITEANNNIIFNMNQQEYQNENHTLYLPKLPPNDKFTNPKTNSRLTNSLANKKPSSYLSNSQFFNSDIHKYPRTRSVAESN